MYHALLDSLLTTALVLLLGHSAFWWWDGVISCFFLSSKAPRGCLASKKGWKLPFGRYFHSFGKSPLLTEAGRSDTFWVRDFVVGSEREEGGFLPPT